MYNEILNQVKKNIIEPTYFLYGTESYFIDNFKKELIKRVLQGNQENLSLYDLEETPIQEVIQDAETYPFFGEKKLVIAMNPVFVKAKVEKLPFEHDLKTLEQYIMNPVDYSIFVLVANEEKLDERKKITKIIKKNSAVVHCAPIKEKDISHWIESIGKERNITIEPDAIEIVATEISDNLQLLDEEMSKFALYVGDGGHVTKEVVEMLISRTVNSSSLRLADAVMDGNLHQAMTIYKDLDKMKEEPIALIGLLAFQFRNMLRVKILKQKGYTQFQMQKQLKLHPFVIKIALNREKRFTIERLEAIIQRLARADATIKRGEMDKNIAFELLLYDLSQTAT